MKEIGMSPMQYTTLDYWRNKNIILTHYKVNIYINSSTKRNVLVRTLFIFIQ